MRKSLALTLAAVTVLVAGTAAYAQDRSRAEDGAKRDITRSEAEQRSAEMFGRMDANDDGLLDQADRGAARREAFDAIDADKDGAISFAEFEARRGEGREARGERRGRGFGHHGRHRDRDLARTADADKNGSVSEAEFTTAALARFDRADANSDGTISLDERREARQQRRNEMRRGRQARDAG